MWIQTYEKTFPNVSKDEVWRLWTDINNWPSWHQDLEYCKLQGDFAIGQYFWLKPKGMPAVKIRITAIEAGSSFTDCTQFFGAQMFDTHTLLKTPEGLKLTNTLRVSGPLSWLWIALVAKNVAQSVPEETQALIDLAKAYHE